VSRGGSDDYEEDFPNQSEFWWANAMRALKGKRGKKALAELREALLALPEKRLVSGAVSTVALAQKVAEKKNEAPELNEWRRISRDLFIADAEAKCEKEGPGVCAVGAYLWWKRVQAGEDPQEAMAALPSASDIEGDDLYSTAELGEQAGLTSYVAWLLADKNDETYGGLTPEQRYVEFLAWLDKELVNA
jgi:hypothetical protein